MNRTTVITALACGLLLTAAAATPAVAATSDTAGDSTRSVDEFGVLAATDGDTLLINGRAFLLEQVLPAGHGREDATRGAGLLIRRCVDVDAAAAVFLVTTVHGFSGPEILPAYREALRHPRTEHLVSISDSDRSPELDYAATMHHGIDVDGFPAGSGGEDLVILGRIHPDKGTAEAVRIAAAAGRRLVICGIVQDERYWREEVEPLVDGTRVVYRGSVGPEERALVLGGALALLHPIGFDEPFGLSVVEAMACGTPVIAYRRGSMAEIIDEGVTGFAVSSREEAVAAVERVGLLDRAAVRETARRRFAVDRMVDEYLVVYAGVLGR